MRSRRLSLRIFAAQHTHYERHPSIGRPGFTSNPGGLISGEHYTIFETSFEPFDECVLIRFAGLDA